MIIQTERLRFRLAHQHDAKFILELVNDPQWLRFIGDRKIYDLQASKHYIDVDLRAPLLQGKHGLYVIEQKFSKVALGLCGLLQRESLSYPDLGYALAPFARGYGYAQEAAACMINNAFSRLEIQRLYAIVNTENSSSIKVLTKLGFSEIENPGYPSTDAGNLAFYQLDNRSATAISP